MEFDVFHSDSTGQIVGALTTFSLIQTKLFISKKSGNGIKIKSQNIARRKLRTKI
jgi:hypothetical protein